MKMINIHATKTHLSKLLEQVSNGEEIIICKSGKPIAKLISYKNEIKNRIPGEWKGRINISDDFDILPDSFLSAFKSQ